MHNAIARLRQDFGGQARLRSLIVGRKSTLAASVLVAALFLVPRLVGLGTVLSVDEPLWRARGFNFLSGIATLTPSQTFQSGQPGVTTMWLAGLAAPFQSLAASQASIAIGSTVVLGLGLLLLGRLTGPALPLVGGVFLALDPFLIAHSRVVHTDALLASFLFLGLVLLALFWRTGERRYLTYSGVVTALATLTKVFGGFLVLPALVVLLTAPVRPPEHGGWARTRLRRTARFAFFGVLTTILLWPAALTAPGSAVSYMIARVGLHTESAPMGSGGGDPWYYPREFLRRETPLATILLPVAAVGLIVGTRRRRAPFPARGVLGFLLATTLLYGVALGFGAQKSDRYLLLLHVVTDLTVGAAVLWVAALLARTPRALTRVAAVTLALASLILARDLRQLHPYYHAQWNHLLPIPPDVKHGWGEGLDLAAAHIRSAGISPTELRVASFYPRVVSFFLPGARVERVTRYEDPTFQYVVLYRSMYGRADDAVETDILRRFLGKPLVEGASVAVGDATFRLEKEYVINRIPYVWVFRRVTAA